MGVLNQQTVKDLTIFGVVLSDQCFYCCEQIKGNKLVYWHGPVGDKSVDICLHAICAQQLAFHLDKDAHKAINQHP